MTKTKKEIANWLLSPDNPGDLSLAEAESKIKKLGLEKVYREIELPLVKILEDMKEIGIKLNKKRLQELKSELDKKIKKLENKIFKITGEKFNLNSPQQLSVALSELLGIRLSSTQASQLKKLRDRHPIIDLVLEYREIFKIKSTYIEPLSKLGNRARTTLAQINTATGRLASQNPNLQNVPPIVKEMFIADSSYQLVASDFSQIELRILAALCRDPKMIKTFAKGGDIHQMTASQVFNKPINKVTPKMRRIAKTLNFGVVYGMGPIAFAEASGLTVQEARQFIAEYFSDFKEVKGWQERVKDFVRKNGFVENLNGRKRWLPAISSLNRRLAAEAERMAINMPVQSLGADIIKLAMIKIWQRFRGDDGVRLLLSIHDELLFEVKNDKVNAVVKEIKELMENIYQLSGVKLEVNVKVGKNWGKMTALPSSAGIQKLKHAFQKKG